MICPSNEHSKILMKLRSGSISDLLANVPDNLKSAFELMEWNASNSAVSLKDVFILMRNFFTAY